MGQGRITPCAIDKKEIWNAKDKINYGGRSLLWQALQGHFPYYLVDAVRGFAMAQHFDGMMKGVEEAVDHGETSGTDALVGLLFYLNSITNPCGRCWQQGF